MESVIPGVNAWAREKTPWPTKTQTKEKSWSRESRPGQEGLQKPPTNADVHRQQAERGGGDQLNASRPANHREHAGGQNDRRADVAPGNHRPGELASGKRPPKRHTPDWQMATNRKENVGQQMSPSRDQPHDHPHKTISPRATPLDGIRRILSGKDSPSSAQCPLDSRNQIPSPQQSRCDNGHQTGNQQTMSPDAVPLDITARTKAKRHPVPVGQH